MRNPHLLWANMTAWSIGLAFAVSGCSSSSDPAPGPTVSVEEACRAYSKAICAKQDACSPFRSQLIGTESPPGACELQQNLQCINASRAKGTSFNAADTYACARADLTCAAIFDGVLPAECMPKPGTLGVGQPCGTHAQCASAFCAVDKTNAICGVCAEPPALGAACVRNACPSGMGCVAGKCKKPAYEGSACGDTTFCGAGFSCFKGTCVPALEVIGAACRADESAAPNCNGYKGIFCVNDKCEKATLPEGMTVNAKCGFEGSATKLTFFGLCSNAQYCKRPSSSGTGTCQLPAAEGQPCSSAPDYFSGPKCLYGARCVDGFCRTIDAEKCL